MLGTQPKVWGLETSRDNLLEVVDWCIQERGSNRVLMVVRQEKRKGLWQPIEVGIEERIGEVFGSDMLVSFLASEWPGTQLVGHPARVFIIKVSKRMREQLLGFECRLGSWTHNNSPPQPEDLCLFQEGSAFPALLSCTHEGDAWVLSDTIITLRGAIRSRFKLQDLCIAQGKYFCKPWGGK